MFRLIFFGSFGQYSQLTLEKLLTHPEINVVTVVTSPPRPGNRGQITKNPVEVFAQSQSIPVLTPSTLKDNLPPLPPADFILVAGYGLLIPASWLSHPRYLALNAHPSLLPLYPGRFPVEWALLTGQKEVGLSIISMNSGFDSGALVYQKSLEVSPSDTRHTLYLELYAQTGLIAPDLFTQLSNSLLTPWSQPNLPTFYARGLTRDDGFIPFDIFLSFANTNPIPSTPWPLLEEINLHLPSPINPHTLISRMQLALQPWPGLWTKTPTGIRLKITQLSPLMVQPESKLPTPWTHIKNLHTN
ncbi:MAG: formyltransferase family protein [Candidatus Shapirobacteria bacterium]